MDKIKYFRIDVIPLDIYDYECSGTIKVGSLWEYLDLHIDYTNIAIFALQPLTHFCQSTKPGTRVKLYCAIGSRLYLLGAEFQFVETIDNPRLLLRFKVELCKDITESQENV